MNSYTIKGVVKRIYSIDYNNLKLEDNVEMIVSKRTNDFHQLLYMYNDINNTYMLPTYESENSSTQTGLFYTKEGFYNHLKYGDPLISFRLNLTGIKNNSFYRIRFIAKGIENFDDTKNTKIYTVLNGKDIIHNKELSTKEFTNLDYILLSEGSYLTLAITIGKVIIKDIIIEEVEVLEEVKIKENFVDLPDLMNLKAYAVFKPSMLTNRDRVITKFPLVRGIGLNILYNRDTDEIIVERNKENDVIQENISLSKFMIDARVYNSGELKDINIVDDISPLSGTLGFARLNIKDIKDPTVIYILVYEML